MRTLTLLVLGVASAVAPLPSQERTANAYDAYRTGEYEAAVSVLSNEVRANPSLPAVVLLNRVLRETGRYAEAEELLRRNIDRDPDPVLFIELGQVLMATGRDRRGIRGLPTGVCRQWPGIADRRVPCRRDPGASG